MISNFEIMPATLEDYPTIQNLARFYAYDISRSCGFISDDWNFPENGLYENFDTKIYFEDPTRKAFLVRVSGELAGFVLLDQEGTDKPIHWNMGEFFITAKFQGKGLGKQVAHQIWDKYLGLWEVSVIPENRPALYFWEATINDYTRGNFSKERKKIDYDKHQPERIIFSFDSHSKNEPFNLGDILVRKESGFRELEKRGMSCMIPHIIGISGVTGAGKSTLTKILAQALSATVVSWDEFDDISTEPSDYIEWYHRGRHYDEFRREALEDVLKTLKLDKTAIHPVSQQTVLPTKYIIFDAPLGRLHEQTGKYIDTCVHLQVPLDVSLCRRILRDFIDPIKTKEALLEELRFYCDYSRPLFFDDDLRRTADLVVNGFLKPEEQLEVVKNYLSGEPVMQKALSSYRSLCTKVYD